MRKFFQLKLKKDMTRAAVFLQERSHRGAPGEKEPSLDKLMSFKGGSDGGDNLQTVSEGLAILSVKSEFHFSSHCARFGLCARWPRAASPLMQLRSISFSQE